ncbi:MAG: flavin reductase family protein, partial [Syntrophus sp. (in: bacteria)]
MKKKSFPLSKVYRLLESGPVLMLTTADKERTNIMTMSWHMIIDIDPPIIGCVISDRNYTFEILKATKECVLNIPTVELAEQAVKCGNTSGRKVDKFNAFALTPMAAACVKAPLIDECYLNIECKVIDTRMAN